MRWGLDALFFYSYGSGVFFIPLPNALSLEPDRSHGAASHFRNVIKRGGAVVARKR
jgi:hypothetical protein